MKKSYLSIISVFLAAIMLLGALSSCGQLFPESQEESTSETPSTTAPKSEDKDSNDDTTAPSATTPGGDVTEPEETTPGGDVTVPEGTTPGGETTKPEGTETTPEDESTKPEETLPPAVTEAPDEYQPAPEISDTKYGSTILLANDLKNGVNAFFTDGGRSDFGLTNKKMYLEYALTGGKAQQITALTNTKGQPYIQNTGDVVVRMENGKVLYASKSTASATANLYRFGYYMYEARFEEQNFIGNYTMEGAVDLSISSVKTQQVKAETLTNGAILVTMTSDNNPDPFVRLNNISYTAEDYPYIAITLKADVRSARGITLYLQTDDHSMSSLSGTAVVTGTDEYVTYIFPAYRTDWYTGHVKELRIDFAENGRQFETYEIKSVQLLKGDAADLPENLGLNRSFYIYSDKLHHMVQIASKNMPTEGIDSISMETKIAKNTVSKVVVKDKNGTHYDFSNVDWDSAEYVGFDITEAGIFGYILPAGEKTDKLEVIENADEYIIVQSRAPEGGKILNSAVWDKEKTVG